MKRKISVAIIILIIAIFGTISIIFSQKSQKNTPKTLQIGGEVINLEIADTDAAREQGLSGRTSLGQNQAVLFVFDKPGLYGFWMKDMNFSIDIAWLDQNKKIIYVEKGAAPESYPKVFYPTAQALYVLETNKDFFDSHGLRIGDTLQIKGL